MLRTGTEHGTGAPSAPRVTIAPLTPGDPPLASLGGEGGVVVGFRTAIAYSGATTHDAHR